MWSFHQTELIRAQVLHFDVQHQQRVASYAEVLEAWRNDRLFRDLFNQLLAESPFKAFRWETPPITNRTATQPFEFVLVDDPNLERKPDLQAFAEHFPAAADGIAVFANLSGDATMIVPCPESAPSAYVHLAAFVRHAPEAQRDALWQRVGEAVDAKLNPQPVWLSTAGAGVAWLHVRIDARPKYYWHAPYKRFAG